MPTPEQRLDQLEPVISELLAKQDETAAKVERVSAQVRQLTVLFTNTLTTQSENIQFLLTQTLELKEGQDRLEQRMDKLEQRMNKLEQGQGRVEQRMDKLEQGQDRVEQRMDKLEQDVSELKQGVSGLKEQVTQGFSQLFALLNEKFKGE